MTIDPTSNQRTHTIEREEWERRYRARLQEAAGIDEAHARSCAEAVTFEDRSDGFEDDPEGAADMELSYWTDDGDE